MKLGGGGFLWCIGRLPASLALSGQGSLGQHHHPRRSPFSGSIAMAEDRSALESWYGIPMYNT